LVACVEAHTEEKITMRSHVQGLEESYKMKKKGAKEICRKQMSQEERDKEIVEIREQFNKLNMMIEEDQRQGWVLRIKTVKWPKL